MKKSLLFVVLLIITACQNKASKTNNIRPLLEEDQIEFAKKISDKILNAQKNDNFYELSDNEATKNMVNGLNTSVQKSSYAQIKSLYGDYNNLEFHSVEHINRGEDYAIFRFKGEFESGLDIEIRAVLNKEVKLAGFFVKPWQDKL